MGQVAFAYLVILEGDRFIQLSDQRFDDAESFIEILFLDVETDLFQNRFGTGCIITKCFFKICLLIIRNKFINKAATVL